MIGLTPKLAMVAAAIGEMTGLLGRGPTGAELAGELDMSRGQIHSHLCGLYERGWLAREWVVCGGRRARRVTLLHPAPALPTEAFEVTAAGRAYGRRDREAADGR